MTIPYTEEDVRRVAGTVRPLVGRAGSFAREARRMLAHAYFQFRIPRMNDEATEIHRISEDLDKVLKRLDAWEKANKAIPTSESGLRSLTPPTSAGRT